MHAGTVLTPLMERIDKWLRSPRTAIVLLVLHALIIILSFVAFGKEVSGDQATYLGLARGLEEGVFSYWTGVYEPPPIEVYRTHGYPVFLWAVRALSHNVFAVKFAQALVYVCALWLLLHWLRRGDDGVRRGNLFLLLMLPQFQMVFYVHEVFPEILMALICTSAGVLGLREHLTAPRAILMGILLATGFWVRPAFLLFPLLVIGADLLFAGRAERWTLAGRNLLMGAVFAVLGPLPFAAWNLHTHGYFKPTPLSGSAVVSNLGFWQLRLPGYGSMHYFHYNYFGSEFIPWVSEDEAATHYATYQEQWSRIYAQADPSMTLEDRHLIPDMTAHHDSLFVTRSAQYAVALDRAISAETWRSIKEEPGYYLASRLYSAVRLWITNVNYPVERIIWRSEGERPILGRPAGLAGWAKALVPFLVTFFSFGIGLLLLLRSVLRHRAFWSMHRFPLYLIFYIWVIHIPMVIQSRYLVPVHMLAIFCITLALTIPKGWTTAPRT